MVFSFFKKPSQKVPERPAAKPRASVLPEERRYAGEPREDGPSQLSEPMPDLAFGFSEPSGKEAPATPAPEEFSSDFPEAAGVDLDPASHSDPVQGDVEQAAVLFANGQDVAVRTLLDGLIRAHPGRDGQRFWLLMFDFLQAIGDRDAFEQLGIDYAEACEMSPPGWHDNAGGDVAAVQAAPGATTVALQGVMTEESNQPVLQLAACLESKTPVVVDCHKLVSCDDAVAGLLAALLERARRKRLPLSLAGVDALLARLNDRLCVGEALHEPSWSLLLELLQRAGDQTLFEERAVDYAVTFERSPPSWEAIPVVGPALAMPLAEREAHCLRGEVKNQRFEELQALLEAEHPVLDFSDVRRLDFFSAGQLVNRLAPVKAKGKEVVIRHPNHLVAELMAVVGLDKQARIIVRKS